MALTKEQQAIEDAYQRAKARQDAQKAQQLKEAAENLALQTKNIGALTAEQKQLSTKQASDAYIAQQQSARVLPSQLAQGGLSQSGYKSLAQQKMAQDLTKNQQGIQTGLNSALQGYDRQTEASKLGYNQNVRAATNAYNQNIADLDLNKKQDLAGNTSSGSTVPVQTGNTNANMTYNDVIVAGNTGRLSYDEYKNALNSFNLDATTKNALLQNYLYYQATRGVQ